MDQKQRRSIALLCIINLSKFPVIPGSGRISKKISDGGGQEDKFIYQVYSYGAKCSQDAPAASSFSNS